VIKRPQAVLAENQVYCACAETHPGHNTKLYAMDTECFFVRFASGQASGFVGHRIPGDNF